MIRPPIVNQALKVLYFSLFLSLINIFVGYADSMNNPEIQSALPLIASLGNPAVLFIGFGLLFWASYVFLAWLLSRRYKWGRFFLVFSVVFALGGMFFDLIGFKPSFGAFLGITITLLQTYSCYLFYRPEASAWFKNQFPTPPLPR